MVAILSSKYQKFAIFPKKTCHCCIDGGVDQGSICQAKIVDSNCRVSLRVL